MSNLVGDVKLSTPGQCFSNPGSGPLGFTILRTDLRVHAEKLGVTPHPNIRQLIGLLEAYPPSMQKARVYFEYLASRIAEISISDWNVLSTLKFVPVGKDGMFAAPITTYFDGDDKSFVKFFQYCDFGNTANSFLRSCGVKDQPTPLEIAVMIVKDPQSFLDAMGFGISTLNNP